jgi:hypothetical protein
MQQNYWIAYLETSHIALSRYIDLNSLPLACTRDRLPSLPSWASNLESDFDCLWSIPSSRAGHNPNSSEPDILDTPAMGSRFCLMDCWSLTLLMCLMMPDSPLLVVPPDGIGVLRGSNIRWLSGALSFLEDLQPPEWSLDSRLRALTMDALNNDAQTFMTKSDLQFHCATRRVLWYTRKCGARHRISSE